MAADNGGFGKGRGPDYWEEPESAEAVAERLHLAEPGVADFWPAALTGFAVAVFGFALLYFGRRRHIPERISEYARSHWLH